jgi:hypothetical protein
MSRIVCRTPSTGKPVRFSKEDVGTSFEILAEPSDYSVPDPSNRFPERDPNDETRAIRAGEVFFLTPLSAYNKTAEDRWIEVILNTEDAQTITFAKVEVPAGDTAFIPLQGRSIFKRIANTSIGDTIEIRAETTNSFDVWIAGEERPSNEHSGVIEE